MLIIDDKIMIVHMRKCGGTSFCGGLIRLLPPDRVSYLGYTPEGEERSEESFKAGGVWKHSRAREILASMPREKYAAYKKIFVSVRPYHERVASFYFHARRHNQQDPDKYSYMDGLSFSDYLRSKRVIRESVVDFCTDKKGRVIVQEFVPFKDLGKRYTRLATILGFPGQKMPRLNNNPKRESYDAIYSEEDRQIVDELFAGERHFLKIRQEEEVAAKRFSVPVEASASAQANEPRPDSPSAAKQDVGT